MHDLVANFLITLSLNALAINERIRLAQNSYSSRIYDVLIESNSVSPKAKRTTVMEFTGHYHLLVDDRIGSRVADRFWEYADTYFKVFLHASFVSPISQATLFRKRLRDR